MAKKRSKKVSMKKRGESTEHKDKTGLYMLAVVGVVFVVAVVVGLQNVNMGADVAGAAVATKTQSTQPTYTAWTNCLDQGNTIKLNNDEGRMLAKKDLCTGSNIRGKQIARVSCVQDISGGFTYKYANPEDCPEELSCKKNDNGAAYCG